MGSFQIDVPLLSQRMSIWSMDAPTQKRLGSWDMESFGRRAIHESSPSDVSSREYFDAEESVRISNTMEQLKAALAQHKQAGFDEEYQSSEEALSPMLQHDATTTEENELEDLTTDEDEDGGVEIMEIFGANSIKVELATAIPVAVAGKAQVVNVPQRWSASRGRRSERPPTRSSSRSSSVATTSNARAPSATRTPPRIDTNVSRASTSSSSISPTEMKYMRSATFSGSHRAVSSITSSGSFVAKSATGERTNMALFEFLKEDPYQMPRRESAPQPQPAVRSNTKSRLRAVSSKLMASLNTSNLDLSTAPDVTVYPQRRRSLIGASRTAPSSRPETASTPFFFSQRSREAWERENFAPKSRPRSSTPATPASASATTPTQRKLPKLVARAANERAPMPELPPCPRDYDMDVPQLSRFDILPGHMLAGRKSSVPNLRRRQSLLGMRA